MSEEKGEPILSSGAAVKRMLIEAPISRNWTRVARVLVDEYRWNPDFWIGPWKGGSLAGFPECRHYYAWDAFNLNDAPEFEKINQNACFWGASGNILESMSKEEYFTFLYMLNRQDSAARFGLIERDRFMKQHLIYWSNLLRLRKIDLIIHSNTPHLPYSFAIYLCARQMKIPVVFFNPTPHRNLHYLENTIGQRHPIRIRVPISTTGEAFEQARVAAFAKAKGGSEEPFYMVMQKKNAASLRKRAIRSMFLRPFMQILKNKPRRAKEGVSLLSEDKRRTIKGNGPLLNSRDGILQSFAKDFRAGRFRRRILKDLYSRELIKEVPRDAPYVFLPLHYQPELTTVPLGADYSDQIYLAEMLRECMPSDWVLIIKEHWSQISPQMYGDQGRFPGYYRELARLPSTRLVDPEVDSGRFLAQSRAVATITGTAGWEALTMGVPCLLFGHAWYRRCPGVHVLRNRANVAAALQSVCEGSTPDPELVGAWFDAYKAELLHFDARGRDLSDVDAARLAASLQAALSPDGDADNHAIRAE